MATPTVLVRRPSPRLAEGLVTHIDRQPVDLDLALRQWERYVETFAELGWQVIEVEPAPECPDSVFIEDTVVIRGRQALVTHPGALSRRPEVTAVAEQVRSLGYDVNHVQADATLDGGDVLKIGERIYVGIGGRSNEGGVTALRETFGPQGVEVVPVPVNLVLHLKSGITALPDGTAVAYEPLTDNASYFPDVLFVPEEAGAHVVVIDDHTVLMASNAPHSADLYMRRGLNVITLPVSEFQKLEGCVTCLSVRLRDLDS